MQESQKDTTTNSTNIRVLDHATSSSQPPTTNSYGGGTPACAACRHQRKKCKNTCVLAPFFPFDKTQEFQTVHRVFGVSNVTKLLKDLSPEDGKNAVESLLWEARCRIIDPVLGAFGEFQRVCQELEFYKTQLQLANVHHHNNNICQVPVTQGAGVYNNNNKSAQQRLIGLWNRDDNVINNYVHSNAFADGVDNTRVFNYGSLQSMERVKKEKEQQQGSLNHPQQQMINDFSQFY